MPTTAHTRAVYVFTMPRSMCSAKASGLCCAYEAVRRKSTAEPVIELAYAYGPIANVVSCRVSNFSRTYAHDWLLGSCINSVLESACIVYAYQFWSGLMRFMKRGCELRELQHEHAWYTACRDCPRSP